MLTIHIRTLTALAVVAGMFVLARPNAAIAQGTPSTQGSPELRAMIARAEGGDPAAEFNLGLAYFRGNGVAQDYAQAAAWWRKAADQGHANAQFNLGSRYVLGQGVPLDLAEAISWFQKASELGHAGAQYYLGLCFQEGNGVLQDYAAAAALFRKSADQGLPNAQLSLGTLYVLGQGVAPDYAEGYKWFEIAASHGSGAERLEYIQNRDAVALLMTPEQIADAQQRARAWQDAFDRKKP